MEELAEPYVIAYVGSEAVGTVRAEDEPDLQGAEAASEGDLPVTVVGDEAGGGEVVAQIRGGDGEGVGKIAAALDIEAAAMRKGVSGADCGAGTEWAPYLASKFVNNHLCIFMLKLSNAPRCSVRGSYSSQTNAAPA